jgi:magnesium transporter
MFPLHSPAAPPFECASSPKSLESAMDSSMQWHDIQDPAHRQLDELAARYALHSLHVGDCRQPGQRTKVANGGHYLFIILKLLVMEHNDKIAVGDLALFVGSDFFITVHSTPVPLLEHLRAGSEQLRPDEALYRVLDGIIESYLPLIERLEDGIEKLNDEVVGSPRPEALERIAEIRSTLLQLRRVLSATRHITFQLRHIPNPVISQQLYPFFRDAHDDLAIHLDTIAGERDRLAGILDIYLSSIANRTTEATKTLTLLGTVALPGLVITSFFGMNINYPAWARSPWMFASVLMLTLAVTAFLFWHLRRRDYLPGGTTSHRPPEHEDDGEASGL